MSTADNRVRLSISRIVGRVFAYPEIEPEVLTALNDFVEWNQRDKELACTPRAHRRSDGTWFIGVEVARVAGGLTQEGEDFNPVLSGFDTANKAFHPYVGQDVAALACSKLPEIIAGHPNLLPFGFWTVAGPL